MTTQPHLPEQEAAATFARECTDHAAVIRWCVDRVRWVDGSQAVQDAADYLHSLSIRAQVDTASAPNRPAIIRECAQEIHRWCAREIHSVEGAYAVERAAEYLDGLAAEFELRGTAEIRAEALLEAADALGRMDYDTDSQDYGYDTYRDAWNGGVMDGAALLRRLAGAQSAQDEAPRCARCGRPKRDYDGRADHAPARP